VDIFGAKPPVFSGFDMGYKRIVLETTAWLAQKMVSMIHLPHASKSAQPNQAP
jgi:hypothetical protein